MAHIHGSVLTCPMRSPNVQRQQFWTPPPYVQRSDGLVIVSNSSYGAYVEQDPSYIVNVVPPPHEERQPPMLTGHMPRWHGHVPPSFPTRQQYESHLLDHHGSTEPQHPRRANILHQRRRRNIPPRQRRNIPPGQRQVSLYSFNNRHEPQPTDEGNHDTIELRNTPTDDHVLNSLPSIVLSLDDQEQEADCVICMMKLGHQEKITKLPCGHLFHSTCVLSWLNIRNTCPLCRFEL